MKGGGCRVEREISAGAMLGIVLISLAAVIGIGFSIFSIAKQSANEGLVDVQDTLNAVSESYFDDFNQKTVTGAAVRSCITKLSGKNYAILLNTLGINNSVKSSQSHKSIIRFRRQDGTAAYWLNLNAILSVDGSSCVGGSLSAGNAFIRVSSTVWTSSSGASPLTSISSLNSDRHLAFENGLYYTNYTFYTLNGNVQFDSNTGSLNLAGDAVQVASNTKFKANLLKDQAGSIIGVVFEQVAQQ